MPAYYYIQSRTSEGKESIFITQEYFSHSQFVDFIMNGIDSNQMNPADREHAYDKKLREYYD